MMIHHRLFYPRLHIDDDDDDNESEILNRDYVARQQQNVDENTRAGNYGN